MCVSLVYCMCAVGSADGRVLKRQSTMTETEVFQSLATRLLRRKTEIDGIDGLEQEPGGEQCSHNQTDRQTRMHRLAIVFLSLSTHTHTHTRTHTHTHTHTEERSSQSSEAPRTADLLSVDEEDIEQYVGSPGHYTPDPGSEAAPFQYSGEV